MANDIPTFNLASATANWLLVLVICSAVALATGLMVSVATYGMNGPRVTMMTLSRAFKDLLFLSWRRIAAIATLTFKEAQRRKAFAIGVLFVLLFMFGGWFLGGTDEDEPARPYVSFVLTAMNFLLILMSLLVACWGIPADIKARSLHTVVTKPVRRSEIVLGRMLGYLVVMTLVLVPTAVLGYFWIYNQVPARAHEQLIARVPVYGSIDFLDQFGEQSSRGVNVGDIWDYRSFIEGGTKSRAIWTFKNLDVPALEKEGRIRLEQNFEAFRTHKGEIDQQIRFDVTLVNPETGLRVRVGAFDVEEFSHGVDDSTIEIPRELVYQDSYELDSEEQKADLFKDLIHNNSLTVEVSCLDPQQYVGAARNDLFIRMPDRSFLATYAKSVLCLWLLLALVTFIGTAASCFLKGPIATIFTASLIFVGYVFRDWLQEILGQLRKGEEVLGGGPVESFYRIVTQMNMTSPLPENMGTSTIKLLDDGIFALLRVVQALIPDLKYFSTGQFTANGFDVPWQGAVLPCLAITVGYFIPLVILGYFSLQLRELEHK